MSHHVSKEMESGKIPCDLYIDLPKAFDTLSFDIIIGKLRHYGTGDVELRLRISYLINRKQYVVYNNHESDITEIKAGVPQGSILGPLFFSILINDLINISSKLRFLIYADDTTIYFNLENFTQQNLNKEINSEIEKNNTWLKVNRLSLNLQKTKLMIFHRKQKHIQNINIVINAMHIETVESFNFLGITLTETLCWDNHVNLVKMKISKVIGILYRLKNVFPGETLITLYTSLIVSYLNYGSLLWGVKSHKVEITLPTRICDTTSTLIDNVYTNVIEKEHTCGILVRPISDHQMYFCMMNENYIKPKTKQKYVEIEVCNQESLEKFKTEIAHAEIYTKLKKDLTDDPNTNYEMLSQILEMAKNKHIPKKVEKFNKRKHGKEGWMTNELLTKVVKKNKL